jgi:hypothetical protein
MRLLSWLTLLSTLLPATARAEGRVAVVNLRFIDVPDLERKAWSEHIRQALEGRGLEVVSASSIKYVQDTSTELFDCFAEDRCRTEIGRRLQADLLLTGTIAREKDEWQANLTLHATDLGTASKIQPVHCPSCTSATFEQRLMETVSDMVNFDRGLVRGVLLVRTRPPGARIKIDGRPVGQAELEVTVVAGSHRLEATHENHDPLLVTVDVKPRERIEVDLKLPPRTITSVEPPPQQPQQRQSWWTTRRIAGVAMAAAGVAMIIASIPLFVIDGTSESHLYRYDTAAGAGALVGIGSALAVTGGVVLLTSKSPPVKAALAPRAGGATASLSFSF